MSKTEKMLFNPVSPAILAERTHNPCKCNPTGQIVGVEDYEGDLTKDAFVQFEPLGSKEPCVLRIAAFKHADRIIQSIESRHSLSQTRFIAAKERLVSLLTEGAAA